jgi:hypothetical protein
MIDVVEGQRLFEKERGRLAAGAECEPESRAKPWGHTPPAAVAANILRPAQKAEFGLQSLDFLRQRTEQRQSLAADPMLATIVLDATHLIKFVIAEGRRGTSGLGWAAEQAEPAIISKHPGVDAGETRGSLQRIPGPDCGWNAEERQCGVGI